MNRSSRIWIDPRLCDFCGTCVAVCPTDAIELEESAIWVRDAACTRCLFCIHICPLGVPREEARS